MKADSQIGQMRWYSIIVSKMKRAPLPTFLIVIFLVVILIPGLHIMMMLAQRLPVGLIPEQPHIPAMGYDVIHHRGPHIPAICHTADAQRVRFQESLTGLLPLTAIAAVCR